MHTLFFFPTFIALYLGLVGEKQTETTNSPFLSQLLIHVNKMFMQTTEIHSLKAMGAYLTDTKRSIKISGHKEVMTRHKVL